MRPHENQDPAEKDRESRRQKAPFFIGRLVSLIPGVFSHPGRVRPERLCFPAVAFFGNSAFKIFPHQIVHPLKNHPPKAIATPKKTTSFPGWKS
jgi:hypothetical protein